MLGERLRRMLKVLWINLTAEAQKLYLHVSNWSKLCDRKLIGQASIPHLKL